MARTEGSGKRARENPTGLSPCDVALFGLQASGIFADVSSPSKFKIIIVKRKTAPFLPGSPVLPTSVLSFELINVQLPYHPEGGKKAQ